MSEVPLQCCKSQLTSMSSSTQAVQLLQRNVQRFRGGLVFKAHRLFVSLNSRLGSNKEEKKKKNTAE